MKLLCMDASGPETSVTWMDSEGVCLEEFQFESGRGAASNLFAAIRDSSRKHGPAEFILLGLGPGSYAGIRQAIACAQGLSLAWNCKLGGLPSPLGLTDEANYQVIGDARRDAFYYTKIENGEVTDGPRLVDKTTALELAQCALTYSTDANLPGVEQRTVSAKLLTLSFLKHPAALLPPEPFYLRAPAITQAKSPPRIPTV